MAHYLITGAAGRIASTLRSRLLREGHTLRLTPSDGFPLRFRDEAGLIFDAGRVKRDLHHI